MVRQALFFLILCCTFQPLVCNSQKVGVVLSGGGATGLAHIGVLQALEEAEIPISYITGTSIGALVGAMYSVGYTPEEMKEYVLSDNLDRLVKISTKKNQKRNQFFLRKKDEDASMLNFNFTLDSIFKKSLPTNITSSEHLDFEIFRILGHPGAQKDKDFDSLFVPFRCVAADIYNKKGVVFKDGDLNAAVRASMAYPFYINPIRINDVLLFDGGLYDNFPADVLYEEFPVDFIIGSKVTSNDPPPMEDDVISQIMTMFIQKTDFSLPCDAGIIIEPESNIGTFEFAKAKEAIEIGYQTTKRYIDSILPYIHERMDRDSLHQKRIAFRKELTPIVINEISVNSFSGRDVSFVENNFKRDSIRKPLTFETFSKRYARIYATPQIKYIFPTLDKNSDSTYKVNLEVTRQKPFVISVGGHFSTRSVNTGYLGLSYLDMGKGAIGTHVETYFGKFYTSAKLKIDYDLPTTFPLRMSPYIVLNRWDYFKSATTFFEEIDPSFLLQNELYYGIKINAPITNNGLIGFDFKQFKNNDQYYQTLDYSKSDTADITSFNGEAVALHFEKNTLDRKQWASEGTLLKATVKYIQGKEKSISGNTPPTEYDVRKFHTWVNFTAEGHQYFKMNSFFKIGIYGKLAVNSKSLFSNYTASVLNMTEFSPLPDSKTLFMEEYRAPQFIGGGLNLIFSYKDLFELRIDPYFFQPFKQIIRFQDDSFGYSAFLQNGLPMIGGSLIFHSPIGPLRLSTNWFPNQKKAWITQLSFGYVIFNNRAIR